MTSSLSDLRNARATKVVVTDETLAVDLVDGRTVSVPLAWYPRLSHATGSERENCCLIGQGSGLHWPDLDEDISVESLLAGHASNESQPSLEKWLRSRKQAG